VTVSTVSGPPVTFSSTDGDCRLCLRPGTLTEDRLDLGAAGLSRPEDLEGLEVTYQATLGGDQGLARLDGIELEVVHRPASARPPATVSDVVGFAEPEQGREVDGMHARAELGVVQGRSDASLTLSAFGGLAIPEDWFVDAAVLRVAHHEQGGVGRVQVRADDGDGSAVVFSSDEVDCRLCLRPDPDAADGLDLLAAGFTEPAQLNALTVDYEATLSPIGLQGTASLDGMRLDVVVRAPALRPASGCLVAPGYDREDAGTCALIRTSAPAVTAVEGSIYAPSSVVDLGMTGVRQPVVSRGVIARAALLDLVPAAGSRTPAVAGPLSAVVFSAASRQPETVHEPTAHEQASGFQDPEQGLVIDGRAADAVLRPGDEPAQLTAADFGLVPAESGSMITSALLTVGHREPDAALVEVVVTPGTGDPLVFRSDDESCQLCLRSTLGSSVLDLRAAGLKSAGQLHGLTVTYRVHAAEGAGVAQLDGMRIEVAQAPTALRARVAFERQRATVLTWSVPR